MNYAILSCTILLRDWLLLLRSHMRYAREASQITWNRNFAKFTPKSLLPVCSMADDQTDSDVPITLLADDDDKPEISKAIATLNETVATLTNSMQAMGESIARYWHIKIYRHCQTRFLGGR